MSASGALRNAVRSRVQRVLRSNLAEVLTTPHGVDRYLEQFNPMWSVNEVRAIVTEVRKQTADTVTLRLKPNANWQGFRAGQYVQLSVVIDGRRCTRCFSPANSVHAADGHIELTARVNEKGRLTLWLQAHAAAGLVVRLSQADGSFALPDARPERILLISGGSGITPVMSMLRTLCDEGHSGRITFLHYARRAQDQLYAGELADIAARHPNVEVVRAYEAGDGGELSGIFCREHLLRRVPDFAEAQSFLCGPAGMMDAVQSLWESEGLTRRLHSERFAPAAPAADDSTAGEVRFARSERLAPNSGDTLLAQAEAAGLTPEYGCRMGVCYACSCRKTSGRVRDLRTGELSEDGEGEVQICVSVPVGTVTLEL